MRLSGRLVNGALAGVVATMPMTAAMRRMHRQLPSEEHYPLPPREIVGSIAPALPKAAGREASMVAHFAYGALCGAALAAFDEKPRLTHGIAGGVGVWLASYLGWIPALGILKPATEHPARRNALMILSHVVWGAAFGLAQNELVKSRSILEGGRFKDVSTD